MGGVSRYFSKVSLSGVDLILLIDKQPALFFLRSDLADFCIARADL